MFRKRSGWPTAFAVIEAVIVFQLTGIPAALAQTTAGTISGTVADHSGAVIRGAVVTITDPATNSIHTFHTNEVGLFRHPDIRPATTP